MTMRYRAAIIGCGQIGALYSKPNQWSGILTHAHAYRHDKRTQLAAVVDIDKKKAGHAARQWGAKAYSNVRQMLDQEKADIISICVPDEAHEDVLEACLAYKPKAVFCEKPLTTDIASAQRIVTRYDQAGILLAVNFSRRWNPGVIRLKEEIQKDRYGRLLKAQGIYTKGILHNGSHMIDLMRYLCGEIKVTRSLGAKTDWKAADPSMDAFLEFSNGASGFLCCGDDRLFSIFELDMLFSKARVSLKNFGEDLIYEKVVLDPVLRGHKFLKLAGHQKMSLNKNMLYALRNVVDALEGKGILLCPAQEAYKTQLICHKILKGVR